MAAIYTKFETGPFKGKYNGGRKYQVDFSDSSRQMGTYHLIDGCKVRVFYRGNIKTCGRCHKVASECLGGGMAKDCDAAGGSRVFLSDHMKYLWTKIGFVPTNFELTELDDNEGDEQSVKETILVNGSSFPSSTVRQEPSNRDLDLSDGIAVKNIPSSVETKDILTFLLNYGLPHGHASENIIINQGKRNSWVVINCLIPEEVKTMFKSIHYPVSNQKFFDSPIFCNQLRNLTPVKPIEKSNANKDAIITADDANKVTSSPSTVTSSEVSTIPGLSKSDQKKASKKAKEKQKSEDRKKLEENKLKKQKEGVNKKPDGTKSTGKISMNLVCKDFMKEGVLEDKFVFSESETEDDDSDPKSKFFTQKTADEENLQKVLQVKRLLSPDEKLQRIVKPRSESLGAGSRRSPKLH